MKELIYAEAEHICYLDGMYFINKKDDYKWMGRRRNLIRRYPIYELHVKDGPNGRPDRSGESGFEFRFNALNDLSGAEVETEIISLEGKLYLKIESDVNWMWYLKTIVLYSIIEKEALVVAINVLNEQLSIEPKGQSYDNLIDYIDLLKKLKERL